MEQPPDPTPATGGAPTETELPRIANAGSRARRVIDAHLHAHVGRRGLDDVKIVASELVNNAVVHGAGRITLRTQLQDGVVRVEVVDEGTGNTPAIRESAEPTEPGGQGLRIVESLSRRWGTFEGTTHVWADVPVA